MSLSSLRDLRLSRMRPAGVTMITADCPRPHWKWLLDDPSLVWLSGRTDVRSHDLRPLVGLEVKAFVDDVRRRSAEVREAVAGAGGVLIGIADGESAEVTELHPWSRYESALEDWRELVAPWMVVERNSIWELIDGISH